ncbi:MAG: hypothetical protein DWP94_13270 [Flavobacterium sp.]|nr:MAG: hypothetical protein DWP94_13270 [Flavobacterium sp.]
MKNQDQIVKEEMRKLIRKSCNTLTPAADNPYYTFQKTLLKYFFNAADVLLDYDNSTISLWTSETPATLGHNLYRLKDALPFTISYTNLEETLKGCLESDDNAIRFYKSMLFQYNKVAEPIGSDAISA